VDVDVPRLGEPDVLPAEHGRDLAVGPVVARGDEERQLGVPSPKKKVTLYFSSSMLEETQREAIRQDRSISWIIQAAWRMSRDEIKRLPSVGAGASAAGAAAGAPVAALPVASRAKPGN
jgi:uncharacterized small protein (TIGR04563 family)